MTVFTPISGQPVVFKGITQLTGVQVSIYDAQTLTPRSAYKDGLATTLWAQPIAGDTNGCVPNIWVVGDPYKVRIVAAKGAYTREIDNLPGDVAAGGGSGPGPGGGSFVTGDYVSNHGTSIITGRVRANGGTIGGPSSGASERADDDVDNLFVWLWNGDSNLVVSGGRGISALADFQANKTIALPDLRGRAALGIDDMGTGPSARLAGGLFSFGNATTLGSTGGAATHTLTIGQLAAHLHTGTTAANAAFQMTGTTASSGSHTHTETAAGVHNHGGITGSENAVHVHDFSGMGAAGAHSHGGSTGTENTTLTLNANLVNSVSRSFSFVNGGSLGGFNYVSDVTFTTTDPNVVPPHVHAIGTDGSHTHGGTTGTQNANHQHGISSDGSHVHVIAAAGAHTHPFTTDAGGVHVHNITTNTAGGGQAHNNCQPFILVTWYLIL